MEKNDYVQIFGANTNDPDADKIINESLACINKFAEAFKSENIGEMDSCLHFPHYIMSGNEVFCWETQGSLTETFFEDLKKSGFKETIITNIEAILVSECKVHFKYSYKRMNQNDEIMSVHDNLWILTKIKNKWGIHFRSY